MAKTYVVKPRIKKLQAVTESNNPDFDVRMNIGNGVRKGKLVSINESLGIAKVLGADGKTRIVSIDKIDVLNESSVNRLVQNRVKTPDTRNSRSVNESVRPTYDISVTSPSGRKQNAKLLTINESMGIAKVRLGNNIKTVSIDKIDVLNEASVENILKTSRARNSRALNEASVMDTINKGVDAVKQGAQNIWDKTKGAVSNLFSGLKKAYGTVVSYINGKFVNATGPVQAAFNQTNGNTPEGVVIYPSNATRQEAASAGANIAKPNIEEKEVDPEEIKEIEDFWMNVMGRANDHADKFNVDEDEDLPAEMVEEAYKYFTNLRYGKLNEAADSPIEILNAEEGTGIANFTFNEVVDYLTDIFASVQEYNETLQEAYEEQIAQGKTSGVYVRSLVPREQYIPRAAPMIWGAPGIGKTQLVRQLVRKFNSMVDGAQWDCFEVDAAHLTPDDFTLPRVEIKEVTDGDGNIIDEIANAQDIVKNWLPMFYETSNPVVDLEGMRRANGPSNGGVLFIDEFSRVRGDTAQVFMNIIQDQKLGKHMLGPGWMIVCAGNRKKDMGSAVDFGWDSAWSTRFMQMNYVPDKADWVRWAREVGINPIIVDWIDSPQGDSFWYEDLSKTRGALKNRLIKAEPRSLVQTANMFDLKQRQRSGESKFSALRKMQNNKGLSDYEMFRIAQANLGNDAALNFKAWMESQRNFTDEDAVKLITEGFDAIPNSKLELLANDIKNQANLKAYARTIAGAFNNEGDNADGSDLNAGMSYRLPTNNEMLQVLKMFDYLSSKTASSTAEVRFSEGYNEFSDIIIENRGMNSGASEPDQPDDPKNYYTDYLHSPEMSSGKFLGFVVLEPGEDVSDELIDIIRSNEDLGIKTVPVVIDDADVDKKNDIAKQLKAAGLKPREFKVIERHECAPELVKLCDSNNYATDYLISYIVEHKGEDPINWLQRSLNDLGQVSTVAEGDDVEKS